MQKRILVIVGGSSILIVILSFALLFFLGEGNMFSHLPVISKTEFEKFSSDQEFINYVSTNNNAGQRLNGALEMTFAPTLDSESVTSKTQPERVSETNIQVSGIDEPDIVKTDGKNIFYSSEEQFFYPYVLETRMPVPELIESKTKIINAFPINELALKADITEVGELLLVDNTLMIFSNQKVLAYDVSTPEIPVKLWEMDLGKSIYISARLLEGKVYMVAREAIDYASPCPVPLASIGGRKVIIACSDIYRPSEPTNVDSTFTVFDLNPKTGEVDNKLSFVGTSEQSVVYVSKSAIYVTYGRAEDYAGVYYNFFKNDGINLLPEQDKLRVQRLAGYELSNQSKYSEVEVILGEYKAKLSADEQLKLDNELNNRFADYLRSNVRDLEKTGLVKIGLGDFKVRANTEISGRVLNQFSLDEYKGNIRIATTSGSGSFGSNVSVNDIYVLNDNLQEVGAIKNLGIDERIYSARFMGDIGYLVTFAQTDPFYVLDLSDPRNPARTGELKIPGFSSYLHELSDGVVLGIGQEGAQVKLGLFDVSNPQNPQEVSKYLMSDFWTEVSSNHHAFLQDSKHKVFFVPTGQGGEIFSYDGNHLALVKSVSEADIKRAVFIDNYMYIIGKEEIVVLNEADWSEVTRLTI